MSKTFGGLFIDDKTILQWKFSGYKYSCHCSVWLRHIHELTAVLLIVTNIKGYVRSVNSICMCRPSSIHCTGFSQWGGFAERFIFSGTVGPLFPAYISIINY